MNESQRLKAGAHDSPVSGDPVQGSTAVHRILQSAQSSLITNAASYGLKGSRSGYSLRTLTQHFFT